MTTMIDPVKRICDELGVCREEAICYLEGFQWNLDSALKACRSQTLPFPSSPTVESWPVNEKSASNTSSTPPLMIDYRSSLNPLPSLNPPDEQSRNQRIKLFCETAVGTNLEEAYAYLERSNWNVDLAVGYFMDEFRSTSPQKTSNPQGKPLRLVSNSQFKPLRIGTSSSDSMEVDSTGEHIPEAIPLMASSQVKIQNVQDSTSVWPPMTEESAEAPSHSPEQPSQLNNKLISSFCDVVGGATREEAIYYLNLGNCNVDQAVGFYIDGVSEDEMSVAMAMSLAANRGLPYAGLPSQSLFQASLGYLKEGGIGSTPSSMEVDLSESGRSLEEAGEENAAAAILGMASSQVDGKAVEEYSSTETFPDLVAIQDRMIVGPRAGRTTITITIVLADGGSVNIPFRSNQTIRDIRDAIDELTPYNDRDYFLRSMARVDYMDSNVTVHEISTGGSTTLLQIYSNP